jgi:hypothetical protein
MYSAEILFAGISFSGSVVHLDGVRILLPYVPSANHFICFSSFYHGGLGHDHDPYVLDQ